MKRRAAVLGNTVHKRQLFHWIGAHLDRDKSLQAEELREKYLECLKGSLDSGLWLTRSQQELDADHASEKPVTVQPMVCFTDNRLSDCSYHAQNYGKLGLGFSKRFVMDSFGAPVNYFSHKTRRNVYPKYFYEVYRHLEAAKAPPEVLKKMRYLMSFLKPVAKRAKSRTRQPSVKPKPRTRSTTEAPPRELARMYGAKLDYLIENEWRIVANAEVIKKLKLRRHPNFTPQTFETYLLRYEAAKCLCSVVLPDRPTLQMLLDDKELRERLFESPQTNVYVLDEVVEL